MEGQGGLTVEALEPVRAAVNALIGGFAPHIRAQLVEDFIERMHVTFEEFVLEGVPQVIGGGQPLMEVAEVPLMPNAALEAPVGLNAVVPGGVQIPGNPPLLPQGVPNAAPLEEVDEDGSEEDEEEWNDNMSGSSGDSAGDSSEEEEDDVVPPARVVYARNVLNTLLAQGVQGPAQQHVAPPPGLNWGQAAAAFQNLALLNEQNVASACQIAVWIGELLHTTMGNLHMTLPAVAALLAEDVPQLGFSLPYLRNFRRLFLLVQQYPRLGLLALPRSFHYAYLVEIQQVMEENAFFWMMNEGGNNP